MLFAFAVEVFYSLIVSHLQVQRIGLGWASVPCSCPEQCLQNPLVPPNKTKQKNHHFIHPQIF